MTSQEALNHGIITAIKIPDVNEVMNSKENLPVNSVYERTKIFMQMSDDYESAFTAKSGIETIENKSTITNSAIGNSLEVKPIINSINNTQEVKILTYAELMALLTAEQKAPIEALQNELSNVKNSVSTLSNQLSEKTTELATVKASYEDKIEKMVTSQDKEFIENLFHNHQLTKDEKDKELKALSSLSIAPEAKEAYKARLAKAQKVVEGEIPDNGERNFSNESASASDVVAGIKAYALKNNIDITKGNGYQVARTGYLKEGK